MSHRHRMRSLALGIVATVSAVAVSGCGSASPIHARSGQIVAVGAENEYADVISQIGGRYVAVGAIESNPNTDPHTFEASPSVAREVATAQIVVQNGIGYDNYMHQIEDATPNAKRTVIDVQTLLGLPDSTPNPHLWYSPRTMPAVAAAVAHALSALQPAHRAYFTANAAKFDASLAPWRAALATFAREHSDAPVAVTEPVGDYMLEAAHAAILTPFSLQADIMNGVDPSPQDVSEQTHLLKARKVKVFVYNQQVTDTVTQSFLRAAAAAHVPVVGVYETMPIGYHYKSWMLAEINALTRAVTRGTSTTRL